MRADDTPSQVFQPVSLLSSPDKGLPPSIELAARFYLPTEDVPTPDSTGTNRLPGLVVGHGAGSRASSHENFCLGAARLGFAVLAIDFRGHGSSKGSGDGPLEQDLLAGVAFLRDHPAIDPALICYRGSSMGAFYGLKVAPAVDFAAMVLLCPANETTMLQAMDRDDAKNMKRDSEPLAPDDAGFGRYTRSEPTSPPQSLARWDRARLRSYFERQDSAALAALVSCPVLIVHARGDTVVPFAHSLRLVEHLGGQTTLVALRGGDHITAQSDPSVHLSSVEWLRMTLYQSQTGIPYPGKRS
jgi:pimeloyl-ACP methyl ester carboxylesterase